MNIESSKSDGIHILGGGPAGLSTGYYAQKSGLDFTIYEAGSEPGGNCRTLRLGDFLFDTGAHRVHDKDAEITDEIRNMLGDDLFEVSAPSEIYSEGNFFRFPLQLANLVNQLDAKTLLQIAYENVVKPRKQTVDTFGSFALNQYGPTLANLFLLNYSHKLWGVDPHTLSKEVSGGRLKGLDLANFIREILLGKRSRPEHIDGSFLYPKYGIGMVADAMYEAIGKGRIHTESRVSKLLHSGGRIDRILINDDTEVEVSSVVNTLPLTLSAKILDPSPPTDLLEAADAIKYRNLILCVFGLDRTRFSPNASLYFPDAELPFTRIYEPKNRSSFMAPEGQTAIVIECPCFDHDQMWSMPSEAVRNTVWKALQGVQVLKEREVVCFQMFRLPFAYPVLEVGFSEHVDRLVDYFQHFDNLHLTGRNSLFRYVHMHDLMRSGKELVDQLLIPFGEYA